VLVALLGITELFNTYIRKYGRDSEYLNSGYNSYRAEFQDYIRPNVKYEEVEEIAQSVGWDEDMWDMLYSMFYFDPRWNFETAKTFVDTYNESLKEQPALRETGVRKTVKATFAFIKNNEPAKFAMVLQGIALLFAFAAFCKNPRTAWLALIFAGGYFCSAAVLMLYLQFTGRLILRAAQCALLPASFAMIIISLISCKRVQRVRDVFSNRKMLWIRIRNTAVLLLIAAVMTVFAYPSYKNFVSDNYQNKITAAESGLKEIEEYAISNPENVYIFDFSFGGDPASYDPFTAFEHPPTNLVHHGGWLVLTDVYKQQLEINGLKDFSAKDYLKDDVYYMTRDPKTNPKKNFYTLLKYLDHTLGNVYAETVEVLPNEVYIIKFRQAEIVDNVAYIAGYQRNFSEDGVLQDWMDGYWASPIIFPLYIWSDGESYTVPETEMQPIQYWINAQGTNLVPQ